MVRGRLPLTNPSLTEKVTELSSQYLYLIEQGLRLALGQ